MFTALLDVSATNNARIEHARQPKEGTGYVRVRRRRGLELEWRMAATKYHGWNIAVATIVVAM